MKSSVNIPHREQFSIVRIAPVCNGKIYVIPRQLENGESMMDLPIEETVDQTSIPSDRIVCKIKERYSQHISCKTSPRFSVRYLSALHHDNTVYLYILPLEKESDIHFLNGNFINSQEIASHPKKYSSNLQKEGELLGMAAELWAAYLKKK